MTDYTGGWFRVADITSEQLERIREASAALIEQSTYPDPVLCVIAAYVAEINEEYERLHSHEGEVLN
jgi:hypothetical protein